MHRGSTDGDESQPEDARVVEPKSVSGAAAVIDGHLVIPAAAVPPAKQLFTVRDCAAMIALSEKTILRLLKRGKLRCITSVRHKRIPAAEIARFIREDLG